MEDRRRADELGELIRSLTPRVLGRLVRNGEAFEAAEDAVQEAAIDAMRVWPDHPPSSPAAWLHRAAVHRLIDVRRSEASRRDRQQVAFVEPTELSTEQGDDTLLLLFICCHPHLSPASQVALTLRAVGGLSTRQIADAFFVPEATMAQRISRAKRTISDGGLAGVTDLALVLRVLSLIYQAGHGPQSELVDEAIRLARQLTLVTTEPEARGLLAMLLLNHARLPARLDDSGRLVTLDEQDRRLWNTDQITEGVAILQGALAEGTPGRYQIQAAIAALHADAPNAADTDWEQILAWYDDLLAVTDDPDHDDPAAVLNRAVAVGHVLGFEWGLAETQRVTDTLGDRGQWHAVRAYLYELAGAHQQAAHEYTSAAARTHSVIEREHLIRRAARARSRLS